MEDKDERPEKNSAKRLGRRAREIGALGVLPIILAVGPIIGALIGQWLDGKFNSSPWLTIVFVVFGFVAAVREMKRLMKLAEQKEKDERAKDETEDQSPD